MAYWKSEAICLRVLEYGETSLIATFLTKERGRIAAIAKGARRRASKFWGELEPLTRSELVCVDRKRSELHTLAELEVVDIYRGARKELPRLHAALYAIELVREGTREQQSTDGLYELLARALDRLTHNSTFNPLTVLIFEVLVLAALGFAPRLDACAECATDRGLTKWAPILGGAACAACAARDRDRQPLTRPALDALRALAEGPERARSLRPRREVLRELRGHLDAYVAARFERRLRLAPHLGAGLGC